jgi:hypothetical protein
MEVPADVQPSDIVDICKAVYEYDSLALNVGFFGRPKAVVEKGLPDFVFELMTPELTPMIFDAAGWQADAVLETFLELLEVFLPRFGHARPKNEVADAAFGEGAAKHVCEVWEVSLTCCEKAEQFLEEYYDQWREAIVDKQYPRSVTDRDRNVLKRNFGIRHPIIRVRNGLRHQFP